MQNISVADIAEPVDQLLEPWYFDKRLIKTQINLGVRVVNWRENCNDAELIADDVLPGIGHLELQMKEFLVVLDFICAERSGMSVIKLIVDIECQSIFLPGYDRTVDKGSFATADGVGVDKRQMDDIQLVFNGAGIMNRPDFSETTVRKVVTQFNKKGISGVASE